MGRDARVVQQLERGNAQCSAHRRVEVAGRAVAMRGERAVELELPAERAICQLGAERHFARLEHTRGPQRAVEREVCERATLLHAQEHLRRQPARRGDRHARASTATVPFASTGLRR